LALERIAAEVILEFRRGGGVGVPWASSPSPDAAPQPAAPEQQGDAPEPDAVTSAADKPSAVFIPQPTTAG
jgi:hypothetical protein